MAKVAVVTGSSTGIGFEAAKEFAKQGYITYATSRNLDGKKGDALREFKEAEKLDNLHILSLDVTSQESVDKAIETILKKEKKIDIYVLNAGYVLGKTAEEATIKEVQEQFDVNYFGVVRCLKAKGLLPSMRKAKSGRIIITTSALSYYGVPFITHYNATKFALEGLIQSEAPLLKELGIDIVGFYPGPVATPLMTKDRSEEKQKITSIEDYKPFHQQFQAGFAQMFVHAQKADDCGKNLVKLASQEELKGMRYPSCINAGKQVAHVIGHDPTGEKHLAGMKGMIVKKEN